MSYRAWRGPAGALTALVGHYNGQIITSGGLAFIDIADAIQGSATLPNITETAANYFVAYAGETGKFGVAKISKADQSINLTTLRTQFVDDHNVAAIIQTNSGKMFAAWATHSSEKFFQCRLSATADSDDWGSVVQVTTSDFCSYMQLHRIPGTARIFAFYRGGNSSTGEWKARWSDDEGATWTAEVQFAKNVYIQSWPNIDGKTIECVGYDNPHLGSDHNVYHFMVNLETGDYSGMAPRRSTKKLRCPRPMTTTRRRVTANPLVAASTALRASSATARTQAIWRCASSARLAAARWWSTPAALRPASASGD